MSGTFSTIWPGSWVQPSLWSGLGREQLNADINKTWAASITQTVLSSQRQLASATGPSLVWTESTVVWFLWKGTPSKEASQVFSVGMEWKRHSQRFSFSFNLQLGLLTFNSCKLLKQLGHSVSGSACLCHSEQDQQVWHNTNQPFYALPW